MRHLWLRINDRAMDEIKAIIGADRRKQRFKGGIMNTKALVAEFVGTFTLIFIGAGAGALGVGGLVGVALAHGLVVMTFAFAYGHISGTHINPAVTIGLLVGKEIDGKTAVSYIIVQLLGGIVAGFALSYLLNGYDTSLGATVLAPEVNAAQGLIVEIILTFLLANAVFNTAVSGKAGNLAPIAIGLTLTLAILMGGPLTGASLNPARTIGPAIASGNYADIWIYLVGPAVGAALAALLYTNLLKPSK
jgi:MIP family channel proteins